jgi:hypothetical protein
VKASLELLRIARTDIRSDAGFGLGPNASFSVHLAAESTIRSASMLRIRPMIAEAVTQILPRANPVKAQQHDNGWRTYGSSASRRP